MAVNITTTGIEKASNVIKNLFKEFLVTVDGVEQTVAISRNTIVNGDTIRVSFSASEAELVGDITLVKLMDNDDQVFAEEALNFNKPNGKSFYKSFDFRILEV